MIQVDQITSDATEYPTHRIRGTFSEYVDHSLKCYNPDMASNTKAENGSRFYGDAKNYSEMYDRCFSGYNAKKVGEAKGRIETLFHATRPTAELSVVGEDLDIARFVEGRPDCWWTDEPTPCRPKVHIILPVSANSGVSQKNFIHQGGALALFSELISDIADIRISTCVAIREIRDDLNYLDSFEIKSYDEMLDIPRIGATTHPSFFRRITFGCIESCDPDMSYGRQTSWKNLLLEREFYDWLGIEQGTEVVQFDPPNHYSFDTIEGTGDYVKQMMDDITPKLLPDHAQA
jgi:hypothetical protein